MEPKIIDKPQFDVIGLKIQTSLVDGQFMQDVSALIQEALTSLVLDRVPNRVHPEEVLGVSYDLNDDGSYTFMLGAEVTAVSEIPGGTTRLTIPTAKYAVFTAQGEMPFALLEKQEYIHEQWLPNSRFQAAKAPRFELYSEAAWEIESPEIQIFLPVIDKA